MKLYKSAAFIVLFSLLASAAWSQQQPPPNSKNVDNLGLQIQDQVRDQDQSKNQNHAESQGVPTEPPQALPSLQKNPPSLPSKQKNYSAPSTRFCNLPATIPDCP